MFDLAEDRTPYIIWKFVAPRDPRSKMEWDKHRALRPITSSNYLQGRMILVDGRTDNHEVYAALEDLRIYCEQQLKGCNDLLNLMNDPRHKLNIYHIEWRVAASGFEPIAIQFEFQRDRMFEILADEIYKGDSYVFLRELLQNSIDAIRMRKEILKRNDIPADDMGVIKVTCKHEKNGDALVTWLDDGIGMDEYIIRNYLSVAGKSYYTSSDFERLGLQMDPISRFGIGLLSCFMVAERIEIETYKEPYSSYSSIPLRISIPSVSKQFRIEKKPRENVKPGTEIKVFIEGKKLQKNENEKINPLCITDYLSIVAGFVEFPIVIDEDNKKTLILNPNYDEALAKAKYGVNYSISKIDLSYPWQKEIFAQDISTAKDLLIEKRINITKDLNLNNYSGVISYLLPNNESTNFSLYDYRDHTHANLLTTNKKNKKFFRYYGLSQITKMKDNSLNSRSSEHSVLYSVYRDGILISGAPRPSLFPKSDTLRRDFWLPIKLVVNIPKSETSRIDLARNELLDSNFTWDKNIRRSNVKRISIEYCTVLNESDNFKRFYSLGYLLAYQCLDIKDLFEIIPKNNIPIPILRKGGKVDLVNWSNIKSSKYLLGAPVFLDELLGRNIYSLYHKLKKTKDLFRNWIGDEFIITNYGRSAIDLPLQETSGFVEELLNEYVADSINFISGPWNDLGTTYQTVYMKSELSEMFPESILEKSAEDPLSLSSREREYLINYFNDKLFGKSLSRVVKFNKPYEKLFGFGFQIMNYNNYIMLNLFKCLSLFLIKVIKKEITDEIFGQVKDCCNDLFTEFYPDKDIIEVEKDYNKFWNLISELHLMELDSVEKLIPSINDFVPGTTKIYKKRNTVFGMLELRYRKYNYKLKFGKSLTKYSD